MNHKQFADEMLTPLADDLEARGERANAAIVRTAYKAIISQALVISFFEDFATKQADAE